MSGEEGPQGFRWEPQGDGSSLWAKSGKHIIGFVGERKPGDCFWKITDVAGSKYLPATSGDVATLDRAKRSLRRAWLRWLGDRGLAEAARPATVTTDGEEV